MRLRLCLVQKPFIGVAVASSLPPFFRHTGLVLEMGFFKEVCLPAVKFLLKPSPLFRTSHRAFVELVTYCMSVPRAGKKDRQFLNLPPFSLKTQVQPSVRLSVPHFRASTLREATF